MNVSRRSLLSLAGLTATASLGRLVDIAHAADEVTAGSRAVPVPTNGIIRGRVWVFGDDIWSSYILTAEGQGMPLEEARKHCLNETRPGWWNQVQPGDIMVAGERFGLGSGRDATGLLKYMGVGGVVAESILPIFVRNSVNAGWPTLECKGVSQLFKDGDQIEFNLLTGQVKNLTTGKEITGQPMPERITRIVLEGGEEAILRKEGFI